jgi:site-specific recombinase
MLGFTPVVGELLGLPLDIRHVAFASASLACGLNVLDYAVPFGAAAVGALGILLIGLANLAVSFGLALRVALRSCGISAEPTRGLARRVLRRFLDRPRGFFWPPAADPVC